jgi:hypothetical protein
MPCNCGGKKGATKFVYIAPDGTKSQPTTEIQAKAAKIRAGGAGEVRPVP